MTGKREANRESLRKAILNAARKRIRKSGLDGLRARDIAKDAGCALGSLYNVFADIDELILHVNSATLDEIGKKMELASRQSPSPDENLRALAIEYLRFADENTNLWTALFEHRLPEGAPVPEWHVAEHLVLMRWISIPLAKLRPDMSEEQLAIQARILFASVHGVVSVSLRGRFVTVPRGALEEQLGRFVEDLLRGIGKSEG